MCGRLTNEIRGGIGRKPGLGSHGARWISRISRENRGLRHEAPRRVCRSPGHMSRSRSQEGREEGRGINGSRTRITGRGRGREVDRPEGPGSAGVGDWVISLGIHESRRASSRGSGAGLPELLRLLQFLGAEEVLDHIFRLLVNETKVLFDVAWPLELFVTQWALVLASLRGFFDVAFQGGELSKGLPAGAEVGLVLVFGGMLLQLVVVWE